jgi:anti-anti-sigma regulatory factor
VDTFDLQAPVPGRLLALSGRLDVHVAADARLELAQAVDEGEGDLVLDLTALEAGRVDGAHRRAGRSGRTLVLRDTPPAVDRLLRRTRLDRVLRQTTSEGAYT